MTADLRVRTNAAERWDTTFFLPLNQKSPQMVQQDDNACSILIPKPVGIDVGVAQELDGDRCGDIAKAGLINDEYTIPDATFTMLCDGGDDKQVDFIYCAAWDNIERMNCSESQTYPGQEPNTKSKCNCDQFNIDVFIAPDPPVITKTQINTTLYPATQDEPDGIYEFQLKVELKKNADGTYPDTPLTVTELEDVYRSETNGPDGTMAAQIFDLDDPSSDTGYDSTSGNTIKGNLTLLGAHNTCAGITDFTLTQSTPSKTCQFRIRIDDEDLPNDATPEDDSSPLETYIDFIRLSAEDANGDPIGDDTCDVTATGYARQADDNCSDTVTVNLENVNPTITISKTPVDGNGLSEIPADSGNWYVEGSGDLTFEIVVKNTSSVDTLTVGVDNRSDDSGDDGSDDGTYLKDTSTLGSIDELLKDNSAPNAGDKCDRNGPTLTLAPNAEFKCRYVVSSGLTNEGDSYSNTASVEARDNENRRATASEAVTVTLAKPMMTLQKKVAPSVDVSIPTPALNAAAFVDEISVDETGETGKTVVYRFTFTNTNSVTKEDVILTQLVDDVLFSTRASDTAQRADACPGGPEAALSITIPYTDGDRGLSNPYVCTIVAKVTGNYLNGGIKDHMGTVVARGDPLFNTAFAKFTSADEPGTVLQTEPDYALVLFKNVTPTIKGEFGLSGTVFVYAKNTSNFETIKLTNLSLLGVQVVTGNTGEGFSIVNDGGSLDGTSYGACPLTTDDYTLAPGAELTCAFTVELSTLNADDFQTLQAEVEDNEQVLIQFVDDDGSSASADAEARVETGANID
ncbi:hypothetical protein GCM10025772_21950 [Ferrimonas gelatinilytica]|uniref:DUF11 domain-containing protein n=1 Tax=Ferrimonas gelatinilytica TaxID=1255257 RepID=A0ABP9S7X0_9GAMM